MERSISLNTNKKRIFSRRVFLFLKWLGISVVLLIFIGFAYQQIVTRATADKYPPVGEMVDLGDYKLHLYALGEANNRPTIILESGLGTPSSYTDWKNIQSDLAKYTRVISYDRAGYGWSESASNERTAEKVADDLHNLLEQSGERGPFILVGHSFGGFTSQVFAQKYKEDVAGLVLIDSSHVEKAGVFSIGEGYLLRGLKEIGVGRILELMNLLPLHEHFLNDEVAIHFFHQQYYNSDQLSELEFMSTKSANQVRVAQAKGFGELPLYILSAEHEAYPEWSELQAQTASLSKNSKHLVVKDASHYIHIDKPKVVIETIVEMMEYLK